MVQKPNFFGSDGLLFSRELVSGCQIVSSMCLNYPRVPRSQILSGTDAKGWICVACAVLFGVAEWCQGGEAERPFPVTNADRRDDAQFRPDPVVG